MAASVSLALDPAHKDIPLYQQVQHAIAEHIAAGRLVPGQQLPSERRLCERFEHQPGDRAARVGGVGRRRA